MSEQSLVAIGRIAALERAVAAIIATHPAPEALAQFWRTVAPGWREDLQRDHGDAPLLVEAANAGMDRFERSIERAALANGQPAAPRSQ